MPNSTRGLTATRGLTSFRGLQSHRGLQNAMFDPAKLFLPGDKGVYFVQNQAVMWSDFARTTPTVRNGGDPSGLVAVIDNMVSTGGTIEAPSSAARPELVSGGVSLTFNVDSFTVDFGTGIQESGSIVVATDRGTWFGEFESEADGTMINLGSRMRDQELVGFFIINKTISDSTKKAVREYFIAQGANIKALTGRDFCARWYLTSLTQDSLVDYYERSDYFGAFFTNKLGVNFPTLDCSNVTSLFSTWQDAGLTTIELVNHNNVTFYRLAFNGNSLDASSINAILLDMQANRNGRTGVDCGSMFVAGTNAPWTSLSPAAQAAAQDLKDNYSWDFTNAFNGGGPA